MLDMNLAMLLSIPSDLSECAVEAAHLQCGNPRFWSLVVGADLAKQVRAIKPFGKSIPFIWVNPEWKTQWMVKGRYLSVFCEGI